MTPRTILMTIAMAFVSPITLIVAPAEAEQIYHFDMSGTRPALSVSVGDRPAELWIFDTGAAGNVVEIERARAWSLANNGEAQIGSPIGGTPLQGFRTAISGARIGDAQLPEFNAVAMPLPAHLERAGVLSPNTFRGQLVTLDFARNELRVREKTDANLPEGVAIPYQSGGHPLPGIDVHVAGQDFVAHLDTGAPHTLTFPYAMASSLPLVAPPERVGVARFVDGERARYRAQLRGQVRVGPLTLTDPEIGLIEGLPFLNVGMGLLNQMTITLDPAERRIWARANG
ncbi:hypothetical protein U91I_01217 [alpha proteobacterium U9-1i]|nr:hypothetical protein U91I_01217 [alpha proteobacterium U9-1i]